MSIDSRSRVSKGVATGGQFAAEARVETGIVLASHAAPTSEAERVAQLPDHERWVKVNGETVRIDRVDDYAKEIVVRESEVDGSRRIPFEDMSMPDRQGAVASHPNVNFADPGFANRHEHELHNISMRALGTRGLEHDSMPADVEAVIQWSRKQSEPLDFNNPRAVETAVDELRSDYARDFGASSRVSAPSWHFKSLLRTVWEDEDCARYLAGR